MKPTQQLLYKHFKDKKEINILYIPSETEYEKSLLKLPFKFYQVPTNPLNSYNSIGFDLIISQGQKQLEQMAQLSHMLHIPIVHLEHEYFTGNPGIFANEYVFPWATQARSWNQNGNIAPTLKAIPNTATRELDFLYLDADQQAAQIAQIIAQKYKIKQIPIESRDFSKCGIFVNLVGHPNAQDRMMAAFSHGCVIVTWNTPFFQEILLDKQTGFLCNNYEELLKTVDDLSTNLTKVQTVHKTILSLIEAKFSERIFQDKWKQIVYKWCNKIYKGVQT